jgi:hypothetical protein
MEAQIDYIYNSLPDELKATEFELSFDGYNKKLECIHNYIKILKDRVPYKTLRAMGM